jgi:hypothetical protein
LPNLLSRSAIEILLTHSILDLLLRFSHWDSSHSLPSDLLSRFSHRDSSHSTHCSSAVELTLGKGLIINSICSLSSPKPVYRHPLLD